MYQAQIDINCDMGESHGHFVVGNDTTIFPYITSSNIACGFHAGDPWHMRQSIRAALHHGVRIGAHPGFPDLNGFGRQYMDIPSEQLTAQVAYQIAAIDGVARSLGGKLAYVKPHGALYNAVASKEKEAAAVIQAIQEMDVGLALMGLAGSLIEEMAQVKQVPFIPEAFADRRYESNGQLRSRRKKEAVIHDPEVAARQVVRMVLQEEVESFSGEILSLKARSICIHGDNPAAVSILKAIDDAFIRHQIKKSA